MAAPGDGRGPILQIDDGFRKLLGGHSPEALDTETGTVLGIWPDARIALCNAGWHRFALENSGADVIQRWPLGTCLLSAISGVLRDYYARAFSRVLAGGEEWDQTYHCHAPKLKRQFRLRVLPLGRHGLLLVHSLLVEVAMPPGGSEDPAEQYLGPDGLIRQCSNCRRTHRRGTREAWDWVPRFVAQPPDNTSHGICATCMNQFYPDL